MGIDKCDNYDTCKKYDTYGVCESDNPAPAHCEVYQKQLITILASIDEKLSKLLEK